MRTDNQKEQPRQLERDISALIAVALSKLGAVLFRNNTGMAWVGKVKRLAGGSVLIESARPLHAGLIEGSSDRIGWAPILITREFVGRKVAVFMAVEVKRPGGRVSAAQRNFLDRLTADGGIGVVASSEDEAIRGLENWITLRR